MWNYFTHLTNFKFFGSSTCSHVQIQSHDTCGQHEAGDWIWTSKCVEDPKNLTFVRYFCFILPQQWPVLVSAHAQNFFSWSSAKKTLQGNTNCSAPNTVTVVSKVENERYLPYLQLCKKILIRILMYFGCKSGRKLR